MNSAMPSTCAGPMWHNSNICAIGPMQYCIRTHMNLFHFLFRYVDCIPVFNFNAYLISLSSLSSRSVPWLGEGLSMSPSS